MKPDLGSFEDLLNHTIDISIDDSFENRLMTRIDAAAVTENKKSNTGGLALLILLFLVNAFAIGYSMLKSGANTNSENSKSPMEAYFETSKNFQY